MVWCEAAQQRVTPPPPLRWAEVWAWLAAERVCGGEEGLVTCYLRHGEHGVFARAEKRVVLGGPPAGCWG